MNYKTKVIVAIAITLAISLSIAAIALGVGLGVEWDSEPKSGPTATAQTGPKLLPPAEGSNKIKDSWLVVFDGEASLAEVEADLHSHLSPNISWAITGRFDALKMMSIQFPEEKINELVSTRGISEFGLYIEPDQAVQATEIWNLDRIDQANLPLNNANFLPAVTGSGVNVYVIDTGIRLTHTQFNGRATQGYSAFSDPTDCNGHGTHVAGTVGGSTYGAAKQANLIAVKVLNCQGSGTNAGVIAGMNWVTANHIKPAIASMSLGGSASTAIDNALATSSNAGVTYVVAAGNENTNACNGSPARAPAAITVGATRNNDARASFSNYGTCVDIFAPGQNIPSAWHTSNTATNTISGTSMSTPLVSGVAALYLQSNPTATPAQVANFLITTSTKNKVTSRGTGSPNTLLYFNPNTPAPGGTTAQQTSQAQTTQVQTTQAQTSQAPQTSQTPQTSQPPAPVTTGVAAPAPCTVALCEETSTLANRNTKFHPLAFNGQYYRTFSSGVHRATLTGPPGADFDLYLRKYFNNAWRRVASATSASPNEAINYSGTAGYYSWEVYAYSGSGQYTIRTTFQ